MRKARHQLTPDYEKGFRIGYQRGVFELAELVADIVSMGQFHEIAERWEELKRRRIAQEKEQPK